MTARKPKGPLLTAFPTRCRADYPNCPDNERLRAVLKRIVRPSSVLRKAGNSHMPQLSRLSGMAGMSRSALARFQSGRVMVMGPENRAKVWAVLRAEGLAE